MDNDPIFLEETPASRPRAAAGSPPRRIFVRGATFLAILVTYFVACCLPCLTFDKPAGPETWMGIHCLALGWMGLFVGQVAWLANPVLAAGMLCALFRRWGAALACSLLALLIGLTTFSLIGQELPADEAGVNKMQLHAIGSGFYVWIASISVLGGGAVCGLVWNRRTHHK